MMKEIRHSERNAPLQMNYVTASVARQSMNSGGMDCFTAFAMTTLFHVNGQA